jgi:hypothetical protein
MSMMYPNGQGIPGAQQFMTGGQPNYAGPMVNFGAAFNQGRQATAPQPGQPQPGAISPPSGPTSGGKAPGGVNPGNFAAKLRAFFQPGGGTSPAAAGQNNPGIGFGSNGAPGVPQQPMLPNSGAGFNPNGLY